MTALVFVEPGDELSLQALGFALSLGDARAVSVEGVYRPAAWAGALVEAAGDADTIVAAGSEHGNEVLAHVAARLDQPFAANVMRIEGDVVTRQRWGGSLLEEARLNGSPRILTVAPHVHAPAEAGEVETLTAADDGSPRRRRPRRGGQRRRLARRREGGRLAAAAASARQRASRSSRSSPACSAVRSAARA